MSVNKHWMVLNDTVRLTYRRREILFHIACTQDIQWLDKKDWSRHQFGDFDARIIVPHLNHTEVGEIFVFLRKNRLIMWRRPWGWAWITPRGMDALLETVGGL